MSLTRREALEACAALLVSACGPTLSPAAGDGELARWLDENLGDADGSGVAGAWRARYPGEASAGALASAIVSGRRRGEPLAAYLARAVVAEHEAGRAELVDGWYLAPTEARLLALLAETRGMRPS